ncbi:MAG: YbaB/EbfC family nucleoid-associated protein [Bacilli bacterium]|nr:YbaB/EbfC family nucleoid-associated protein [Bacilli bacterium]
MNMQNLVAQAQRMQKEITKKQEEIYNTSFVGKSEWVSITMKGNKKIEKVDITYEGNLDEEREMLADMIAIAMRDCISNIDKEVEKKLGAYSQQLGGLF